MSDVSLIDGHIDNRMSDKDIIKALECCGSKKGIESCFNCPLHRKKDCVSELQGYSFDLINRQKAEIERLQKRRKPTETSGFKIENGKVVFYTNMLNGYRHELKDLEEVVDELNLMLQEAYKTDEISGYLKALQERYKTAKSEAIKEFAESLKEKSEHFELERENFVSEADIDNLVKEMT